MTEAAAATRAGRMTPLDGAALTAVIVIWGFNFIAGKIAIAQIPPILMTALRFAAAALMLAPFLRPLGGRWRPVVLLSVTLGVVHYGLNFTGLKGVDAGVVAVVAQLYVPFSAVLAWIVFGERMRGRQLLGLAVAFGGAALLAEPGGGETYALDFLMVVGGAFMFAVASVQIKKLTGIDPFTLNAWTAVLSAPQLLIVSLLLEDGQMPALAAADWRGFGAVAYLAVFATVAALAIWCRLLARYPVNRVVPPTLLAPVLAMGIAVVLLDEPLTGRRVAGALLTMVGVALVHFRPSPAAERAP